MNFSKKLLVYLKTGLKLEKNMDLKEVNVLSKKCLDNSKNIAKITVKNVKKRKLKRRLKRKLKRKLKIKLHNQKLKLLKMSNQKLR